MVEQQWSGGLSGALLELLAPLLRSYVEGSLGQALVRSLETWVAGPGESRPGLAACGLAFAVAAPLFKTP